MNKSLKRPESVPQGDNPPYRAGAGGRTRHLPKCDDCGEEAEYVGEGTFASEFWCKNCEYGWTEPT